MEIQFGLFLVHIILYILHYNAVHMKYINIDKKIQCLNPGSTALPGCNKPPRCLTLQLWLGLRWESRVRRSATWKNFREVNETAWLSQQKLNETRPIWLNMHLQDGFKIWAFCMKIFAWTFGVKSCPEAFTVYLRLFQSHSWSRFCTFVSPCDGQLPPSHIACTTVDGEITPEAKLFRR